MAKANNQESLKQAHPKGRRKWLYRLLTMTIVPTVFLGVVELILRLGNYGYPASFFLGHEIDGRPAYVENRYFGRHFFPKGLARTPEVCTFPAQKSPGTYRIFILGESAAMGYPDSSVNFARILKVMLEEGYPDTHFEVINTSMVAINSHVILPIARDCARHQPDLFVVYMGNNEVVGPYGTAGVLGPFSPRLSLIRASVHVKSLRLGQLIANLMQRFASSPETPRDWDGMKMFAKSQVRADDPRMEAVYANFARNLRDICEAGTGAGAKVVVATVATNLKDSAPFASLASPDLVPEQAEAWKKLYDEGVRLESASNDAAACEAFRRAAAIDDTVADLHFRLGRCLAAVGKPDEAHRHFVRAQDLDALRFRADSRINEAIRTVAAGREAESIYLTDAQDAFARASIGGSPGEDLFFEHVHMNFAGNYLLAQTVFEQVARILPESIGKRGSHAVPASSSVCMERLAFGDWKRHKAIGIISDIAQQPPFTDQLDCAERNQRLSRQLKKLQKRLGAGGYQEAITAFERALERDDGDFYLHWDLTELLLQRGLFDETMPHLQKVMKLAPQNANGYYRMALVLRNKRKFEQALAFCADALRVDPEQAGSDNLKGGICVDMGKFPEAIASFNRALKIDPFDAKIYDNLGLVLAATGQLDDAIAAHNSSLRLDPKNAKAHFHLARIYHEQRDTPKVIEQLTEGLKIDPNVADAHAKLGKALAASGRDDEALDHFRTALGINANLPIVHGDMAKIFTGRGKLAEAISHLEEALRLQPGWTEAAQTLSELRQKNTREKIHD